MAHCGTINIWVKLVEDKSYFSKVCSVDSSWCCLWADLVVPCTGNFLHGKFNVLLLGRKGEVRALPASAVSEVSSAKNNQMSKQHYFGIACLEPLHD